MMTPRSIGRNGGMKRKWFTESVMAYTKDNVVTSSVDAYYENCNGSSYASL